MKRKLFLAVVVLGLLLMAVGGYIAMGQEGEEEAHPIVTTATDSVGVGTYVAAQAMAFAQGEDPAVHPQVSTILPYGIYPDMQVMAVEDFVQPEPLVADFTFAWVLTPAEGSSATLLTAADAQVAIFFADVEGVYDLTLTATSADGVVSEETWTVYATTYVGSGYLDGPQDAQDQCIDCHEDVAEAWILTGHASMFARGVDGELSPGYNEACITCHTTGNNPGENGGFDDVAAAAGWTFPETLQEGNWDAILAEFPEVAAMANIQCESCHGPGYLHVFEATRSEPMISSGLAFGTCAQCHAEHPYHLKPQQWENSAHGQISARTFTYPIGEDRAACVRCHSGVGFVDFAAGLPQEEWRTDYQPITCAVCHDPHDVTNPNQLRVFDTVVLPSGLEVTNGGPSATCMSCHNGRTDAVAKVDAALADPTTFGTSHYSVAAELMTATGGYTWGMTLPTSPHFTATEDACVTCHMAGGPGIDNMGTPDDHSDDQPLPGHLELGDHSFAMVTEDGLQNTAACQNCHTGLDNFDREAFRDYDGDGAIETNSEEVAGLFDLLKVALEEKGVVFLDHRPYFEIPADADANLYGAIYNYKFIDGRGGAGRTSAPVHNLKYTVSLLQLSYQMLTGNPVPNAYILEAEAAVAE